MYFTSSRSVSSGDFELSVNPIRLETRKTCVSTAMAGKSKATDNITLAVFLPTSEVVSKSSIFDGTTPR